jgi:hypothetical protein
LDRDAPGRCRRIPILSSVPLGCSKRTTACIRGFYRSGDGPTPPFSPNAARWSMWNQTRGPLLPASQGIAEELGSMFHVKHHAQSAGCRRSCADTVGPLGVFHHACTSMQDNSRATRRTGRRAHPAEVIQCGSEPYGVSVHDEREWRMSGGRGSRSIREPGFASCRPVHPHCPDSPHRTCST